MAPSPYDDGWLVGIDCRVAEHQLNHPRTESVAGELAACLAYRDVVLRALPVDDKIDAAMAAKCKAFYDKQPKRKLSR